MGLRVVILFNERIAYRVCIGNHLGPKISLTYHAYEPNRTHVGHFGQKGYPRLNPDSTVNDLKVIWIEEGARLLPNNKWID